MGRSFSKWKIRIASLSVMGGIGLSLTSVGGAEPGKSEPGKSKDSGIILPASTEAKPSLQIVDPMVIRTAGIPGFGPAPSAPEAPTTETPFRPTPSAPVDQQRQSTADRKSTRLNSSHIQKSRMPSSA